MNLVAMAMMAVPQTSAQLPYRLERVWSVPLEGYVSFVDQSETSVDTTAGKIDVASGRRVEVEVARNPAAFSKELFRVDRTAPIVAIEGQPTRVVWENERFRLAIDRNRPPFNLYQVDAKSGRTLGMLFAKRPLYDEAYLSGKPERGWLIASASSIHTGRQAFMSYLILLSPPRYSPPRFIGFHDIRDFNRLLGVAISPKQSFEDVLAMPYTPQTPLSMGNAFTGKIEWTNDQCSWGKWIGPIVLAQVRRGPAWVILDGRSGKALPSSLPELAGSLAEHEVRVVGKNIVVRKVSHDERSTTFSCFTLTR